MISRSHHKKNEITNQKKYVKINKNQVITQHKDNTYDIIQANKETIEECI